MQSDAAPLDEPLRHVLRDALVDVGCPADIAQEVACEAWVAYEQQAKATLVMVNTPAFRRGVEYPSDPEEIDSAMGSLARQIADDNAEATDRAHRGQFGYFAFWPLPDREHRQD